MTGEVGPGALTTVWPLTMNVAPSSCAIVNGLGELTDILPTNSQIVGSIRLPDALSTRLLSVKPLDASHAPMVSPVALKFTPVVVNVTSALAVVHAATP